ncbi:MAG: SulP family inorganic anion transporter [Gammaproteobacteria bacterium]|nr:SulP family inorganic anion transporter [Gammaproteobacteria bacterium]
MPTLFRFSRSGGPVLAYGPTATRRLHELLPFLKWGPRLDRATLRADLLAGLTGAIVVLPQGVAFAHIAGLPVEYGLYAAMVPPIVAALFGSSWHLVSGPTTAVSLVLVSALGPMAEPESARYVTLALTLTFMVGVMQLALGAVRMGVLVNFVSHSVIVGFTAGAGVLIATKQLGNFLGLEVPRGEFYENVLWVAGHLGQANPYALAVAGGTLLVGVLVRWGLPRIPYMIVAMLAGGVIAVALDAVLGAGTTRIAMVGALPSGLPPLSAPDLSPKTLADLAPIALAATLFALTEAVTIARSIGLRSGQHIDGNQEFIGQGLSNIAGSLFSGYVASGSFNRSGVNYEAGARTPFSAIIAGLALMLIVTQLAPLGRYLPYGAMAGVLVLVAWGLIDRARIREILHVSRSEAAVLGITFFSTLFLELQYAIFIGVLSSLVVYLSRTSRPRMYSRVPNPDDPRRKFTTAVPGAPECPQLQMLRIDGSLFFGAVAHVRETLRELEQQRPGQRHLLILAQGVNFIDMEGAELLAEEARRRRARGGDLYLYRVKEGARATLYDGGYIEILGEDHIFQSKTEAVARIFERLDPARCRRCTARIFGECRTVPHEPDAAPPAPAPAGSAPRTLQASAE